MTRLFLASAFMLAGGSLSPALADVVQVDASSIQGDNVLFNEGGMSGSVVDGFLNNAGKTTVVFTGNGNAILVAKGGQASISGDFDAATQNPNDTIPLNGFSFALQDGGTFNNAEFNLFGGDATGATFAVTDDTGQVFNFSGTLGNGSNFFGFQAIDGQSIRSIAFTTEGGGVQDVRQIRLGLTTAPVPEPATWAMMIGGLGLIGAASRRRGRAVVTCA